MHELYYSVFRFDQHILVYSSNLLGDKINQFEIFVNAYSRVTLVSKIRKCYENDFIVLINIFDLSRSICVVVNS